MRDMETAEWIEEVTGASVQGPPVLVQELWSGYGAIERWWLGAPGGKGKSTVILKRIDAPAGGADHPRGWATNLSDARKRRSYVIERRFYADFAPRTEGSVARMPRRLGARETETGGMMLLEDLDAAGFGDRRRGVSDADVRACVRWLATFHATFLGQPTDGLWERGTYWHLDTRPDELAAMEEGPLKNAAPEIDARLGAAQFRTLVHGDAKLANFCFPTRSESAAIEEVAAVDLQYVGGGIGVQDLAYFLGSCLDDEELTRLANGYLDAYFEELAAALRTRGLDSHDVESEWRRHWPDAWADFHRFLAGWAPGHWKMSTFSERLTRSAL